MNSIERNESWNDDNDFLSGAFHGAAAEMPGGEVDELHVSFAVVRDRVRRRRAAKIGSLAGTSLVLAGALALGVAQTPLLDRAPVLPLPGSPSDLVDPDGSPGPSGDPAPAGTPAASVIRDGYQPSWLDWSDLRCGMPADDLATTAQGWSVASAGDIYARTTDVGDGSSTAWGMAATVREGDGGPLDVAPVLVWSQDGTVVDVGPNVFEPGVRQPLLGSGQDAVEAEGRSATMCAPTETETGMAYETPLPGGDYEVRVVAFPQVASGEWATSVSEPVTVRLDADGAHSRGGARGGDATIEPPAPADGELSRFELDRSAGWTTAEMTQLGHSTDGAMRVVGRCESSDPADRLPIDLVLPSTGAVLASTQITCDGQEAGTAVGVLAGGTEVVDIRLPSVPDGVARLWVDVEPEASGGGDAAGECSASGMAMEYDPAGSPVAAAGETAAAIVEAALACDSDRLVELASQHGTELMYSLETPEQTFGLPENDTLPYQTLVALLAGTRGHASTDNPGNETVIWPRVAAEEFADSNEAWQEVVQAGLLTAAEADAQRADGVFGYTGMIVSIDESGTWRIYGPTE